MLSVKEIQAYIAAHSNKVLSYKEKVEYSEGFNSHIFDILKGADTNRPNRIDNRVPIAYANLVTTTFTGYMASPGNIKQMAKDDAFNESLGEIYKKNKETLMTTEEFRKCLSLGDCFELHWHDGESPRFKIVSPQKMIPVYNNEMDNELSHAIYYYITSDVIEEKNVYNVWVYDTKEIQVFSSTEGWAEGEPRVFQHSYGQVPVVHYNINPEVEIELNNNDFYSNLFPYYPAVYEKVKKLIDSNDRVLSEDVLDELQRFANAYLKIRGLLYDDIDRDDDGRTKEDKVKYERIIQFLEKEGDAEFMTKEVDSAFLEFSFNKVEKLIYKMSNIVDFSDPKAIQESGYAFRLQLLSMEFAAITYETYFTLGLQKRISLLKAIASQDPSYNLDENVEVNISWVRNIPVELEKFVGNITTLASNGLISEKTAVEQLPKELIPDPEEEIKRLKSENEDINDGEEEVNEEEKEPDAV